MTPLFTSGEIAVTIKGETIILRLTPRACALIEQKTGADAYMEAIASISAPVKRKGKDGDDGDVTPVASKCLAIFEALLEAAKQPPELADEVSTPDQFVIIGKLITMHLRPVPEGAENPPKAAASSTPVA